jgi:hypothetical protein
MGGSGHAVKLKRYKQQSLAHGQALSFNHPRNAKALRIRSFSFLHVIRICFWRFGAVEQLN